MFFISFFRPLFGRSSPGHRRQNACEAIFFAFGKHFFLFSSSKTSAAAQVQSLCQRHARVARCCPSVLPEDRPQFTAPFFLPFKLTAPPSLLLPRPLNCLGAGSGGQ